MLLEVDLCGTGWTIMPRMATSPYKTTNKQQMKAEDLYDSSGGLVVLREEECVLEEEILIVL